MSLRSVPICLAFAALSAVGADELRFCIRADPKTFNPLLVEDEVSETIRYLTGGSLVRVNRQTQQVEPELATNWTISSGGSTIEFRLRSGVRFSDGSQFSSADVVFTLRSLLNSKELSPTADSFRAGLPADISAQGASVVTVKFAAPIAGLARLFDQVAIMSAASPQKERAVLGPFFVADYKPGIAVVLARNSNYWKRDAQGRQLPYLGGVRLEIQQNRDTEALRFRRGELHLINNVDADFFERLAGERAGTVRDVGPALDAEMMWFNQVRSAPIPAPRKAWFASARFRRAVSEAINREDICRLVYRGHATPAAGPVSPANHLWFRAGLKPHPYDPAAALRSLEQQGFRRGGGVLRDSSGAEVAFTLITNAGNKARERMAAMIQQDLRAIGIKMNVVPLDFQSLLERITRSFDYDACLLGLVNTDLDPNGVMNVWLSSASNHQWNPNQKKPETEWEAEIDKLMRAQSSEMNERRRKTYFDRVQQIAWEQAPMLYLVHRNSLTALSPALRNVIPVPITPQLYWNIDRISIAAAPAAK